MLNGAISIRGKPKASKTQWESFLKATDSTKPIFTSTDIITEHQDSDDVDCSPDVEEKLLPTSTPPAESLPLRPTRSMLAQTAVEKQSVFTAVDPESGKP